MIHEVLAPLLAGLLVGVNPFLAPSLHARLQEKKDDTRLVLLETTLLTPLLLVALVAVSWRFAAFISGRLTNSLLFLGLFALAGAVYALRPLPRRTTPDPPATGWRWSARYAADNLYTAGPAWVVATAIAMKQVTFLDYVVPYLMAALGILLATLAWTTALRAHLPPQPPLRGSPRTRATVALAVMYACAGSLMLAGNLKLL